MAVRGPEEIQIKTLLWSQFRVTIMRYYSLVIQILLIASDRCTFVLKKDYFLPNKVGYYCWHKKILFPSMSGEGQNVKV